MQRAILPEATPDQVAEAVGTSLRAAFERWDRWADVQRRSLIVGRPGVTEEDYTTVRACFAAAVRGIRGRSYLFFREYEATSY